METVVIKIPAHIVPSQSGHLVTAVKVRKWCHKHVQSKWHSFFLNASDENKRSQAEYTTFIAFSFANPKDAFKFRLKWMGNE